MRLFVDQLEPQSGLIWIRISNFYMQSVPVTLSMQSVQVKPIPWASSGGYQGITNVHIIIIKCVREIVSLGVIDIFSGYIRQIFTYSVTQVLYAKYAYYTFIHKIP